MVDALAVLQDKTDISQNDGPQCRGIPVFLQFVSELRVQGFRGEIGEVLVVLHLRLQIRTVQKFRREQQDPSADMDVLATIFLPADLARLHGNAGSIGRIEHLHSIGQVPGEILLDEETIDAVIVQAGTDW